MHLSELSATDSLSSLRSTEVGLDHAEAARRLREYGENRLAEFGVEPEWRRLAREFTHFFALILWVAAALAFFAEHRSPGTGMWQLGVAIVAVILINGSFSWWQETRAGRAIDALRELLPQTAKVVRAGRLLTLPAAELVPGDVIVLEAGDNVPADCRLLDGAGVRINIAPLTGESQPQARTAAADATRRPPLESRNLLPAGAALISGEARALVFATGMRTEFGRIAHLTQTTAPAASHLQLEIARL